jgi:hypothetical protein
MPSLLTEPCQHSREAPFCSCTHIASIAHSTNVLHAVYVVVVAAYLINFAVLIISFPHYTPSMLFSSSIGIVHAPAYVLQYTVKYSGSRSCRISRDQQTSQLCVLSLVHKACSAAYTLASSSPASCDTSFTTRQSANALIISFSSTASRCMVSK